MSLKVSIVVLEHDIMVGERKLKAGGSYCLSFDEYEELVQKFPKSTLRVASMGPTRRDKSLHVLRVA